MDRKFSYALRWWRLNVLGKWVCRTATQDAYDAPTAHGPGWAVIGLLGYRVVRRATRTAPIAPVVPAPVTAPAPSA